MGDHFAAFSFVDRIVEYEAGRRARGRYAVPADIAAFPPCLVAEAVGQLAAWVAMAQVGFRGRPVAALANETRFRSGVAPGQHARSRRRHRELRRARGRLCRARQRRRYARDRARRLPRSDAAGRGVRFARRARGALRAASAATGAPAGRFRGVDAPRVVRTAGVPGVCASATLFVPGVGAVLRRPFPAPAGLPGDALARLADRSGDGRGGRGDALAHRHEARALADDAREDALVHAAGRRGRHRRGTRPVRRRWRDDCASPRGWTARRPPRRGSRSSPRRPGHECRRTQAPRRHHRHRTRHAGRQRRGDDVGRAARRPQRRRGNQPVRRQRLPGSHRRRSEEFPR